MKYLPILLLYILSTSVHASPWPTGLAQSVFDGCSRMGGEAQCQCVVIRLQDKFTFEDMRLSSRNKLAKEAVRQMIGAFNEKCLEKDFKDKTSQLAHYYVPR